MSARIIDGKAIAQALRARIAAANAELALRHGVKPALAVVLVGTDPASEIYVRSKARQAIEAGMRSVQHRLSADTSEGDVLALVRALNDDPSIDGILVQLPLPAHINPAKIIQTLDPAKDVDGFHPVNAGLLATGGKALVPCTPLGCLLLLRHVLPDLAGREAVVVGRSTIVGKPMAQLLIAESCTVTVAHSRSRDLPALCRRGDILIAAVGRPELIRGDWVKPGAVVIDVGINRVSVPGPGEAATRLVGDVAFKEVAAFASAITPVPGGVGPMTIACLLANTVSAACARRGLPEPAV